jgi:signal transduction histidine kinase
MLARLPFRSKLMLVVSIPLLVLLVFAGFAINARFDAMAAQDQVAALSEPFAALGTVARDTSAEGVASETFARTRGEDPAAALAALQRARAATDRSIAALRASVGRLDGNVPPVTFAEVSRYATGLPGVLRIFRGAVDHYSLWITYFAPSAHDALNRAQDVVRALDDHDLAAGFESILDLRRRQVALGDQATALLYTIRQGAPDPSGVVGAAWVDAIVGERTAEDRFANEVDPAARAAYLRSGAADVVQSPIQADAATGGLPATLSAPAADYEQWYAGQLAQIDRGVHAVSTVVGDVASSQRSDDRTQLLLVVGGTALLLAGVLVLSWVLVRSVTRPLRALTRAARDVSERRLPQLVDTLHRGGDLGADQLGELTPIRVESEDEVGELAKAFNTIQQVTVAVAEDQAALLKKGIGDLYVNLARRNQSLLDRQISLLDEMEARVDEPDELGSLFELDHLATRMRRNAESLLVLSGSEQPRQWRTAMPLLDVARGAAAEIADFARISYFGFEGDLAIAGNAVADVSHLLAELLENAAAFSPPATPVVVAGRAIERRFVITITDEGIGMNDERLAGANALLARPPAAGLSLSRTLGLYVVAHLAARHGIHVQLRHAPGTGLTAVVALPASILARTGEPTPSWSEPAAPATWPDATAPSPVTVATDTSRPPDMTRPPEMPREPQRTRMDVAPPIDVVDRPRTAPATESDDSAPPAPPSEPVVPRSTPGGWRLEDPGAPATSNDPGSASDGEAGPRRAPGAPLESRRPGEHLTHQPGAAAPSPTAEVRPRPERVAELLNRHERGKREGMRGGPGTPASPGEQP